jgi:hypothetical protein
MSGAASSSRIGVRPTIGASQSAHDYLEASLDQAELWIREVRLSASRYGYFHPATRVENALQEAAKHLNQAVSVHAAHASRYPL